jgi:5-methyltetrahydropteroyltriglutamate--homocysteine methyltransferase
MSSKYRADHVGSLLRPREILEARQNPAVTPHDLEAIEDRHILRVLARQRDLGLKIFTDGELRRQGFMSDFYESVDGLDDDGSIARAWHGTSAQDAATSAPARPLTGLVVERIKQKKRLTQRETAFLQRHSPGDVKVTLPSANQFPAIMYQKGLSSRAYPTYSEFLWDVVPVIKSEIRALAAEGVKYIQLDAPRYSYYLDPRWRHYINDEMGIDPDQALDEAIRADNACLDGTTAGGRLLAIHLCRGNYRSQWYAEGGYDPIAEKVFNQLLVDAFLLEYDSDRAGTFEPLRFVPHNKMVVLGLISSKSPGLESQDQLLRRIDEACRYVPIENLALSPQCGFASSMEGNLLTEDEQWRKLQLVVDTAWKVWQDA